MNKLLSRKNVLKKQTGFTLLEILVALLLGSAILAATINMQIRHRKGFTLSTNQLEMQSNAKFAFEFISQYLRSAGTLGCRNSQSLKGDAETWALPDNCMSAVCLSFNDRTAATADFRPGREVLGYEYTGGGMVPALPGAFSFVAGGYYNTDSDIITVTGGIGEVYGLDEAQSVAIGDTQFQLDMTDIDDVILDQYQYGMLSGCGAAQIFKVTSTNGQISTGLIALAPGGAGDDNNGNGLVGSVESIYVGGLGVSEFRRAAVTTFYVGQNPLNDPNGVPTLYQDVDGVSSQLVEGVEEMHILYGLSDHPTARNVANRYVTADVIAGETTATTNRWEDVVSVRIGLIMRSSDEVYETNQSQTKTLDCVNYTQNPKNDRYSRKTYCTEIAVRNRLLGTRVGNK
ncbi:MAG: PilW family protein [Gammaproteobacteria bacterium]|nr:PilW family protein [Gammaproteobacteria bacterium]